MSLKVMNLDQTAPPSSPPHLGVWISGEKKILHECLLIFLVKSGTNERFPSWKDPAVSAGVWLCHVKVKRRTEHERSNPRKAQLQSKIINRLFEETTIHEDSTHPYHRSDKLRK